MTEREIVYLVRPTCPKCGGVKLRTLRSVHDQGDGSTRRSVKCAACGYSFILVLEPSLPNYGKGEIEPF